LELRQYLDILRRRRWFILESVVAVALVAGIVSSLRTPIYQASARVLLRPNDPTEQLNPADGPRNFSNDPDRYVTAQQDVVRSENVAREAAKSLQHVSVKDVEDKVSVGQGGQSDVIKISATDTDAAQARDIANAVAKGYIENRRQNAAAGLQRAADEISSKLAPLQAQIGKLDNQIGSTSPLPGATATLQGQPAAPVAPSQPASQATGSGLDAGGQPTTNEALKAARYAAAVQYETLYARQQELLVDISLKRGEAELISEAKTPTSPASPKPMRDAALGAFAGLLLGVGICFVREQLDDRVHSAHEVERATGLPLLVQLPYDEESAKHPEHLAAIERPLASLSEAARSLRTAIQFLGTTKPVKVVVVTSAAPGEGKSLVAANLAAVYAQAGNRTLLVAADLRRPRLSTMFETSERSPGLTGVIAGLSVNGSSGSNGHGERTSNNTNLGVMSVAATVTRAPRSAVAALVTTPLPELLLLPSGPVPPNPAELLGSTRMTEVLEELAGNADIVIIDSPPLLAVTDAAVLAAKADGVVLVTALGETHRGPARRAKELLDATGARLLGVVINKTPKSDRGYYSGYYAEYSKTAPHDARDGAVWPVEAEALSDAEPPTSPPTPEPDDALEIDPQPTADDRQGVHPLAPSDDVLHTEPRHASSRPDAVVTHLRKLGAAAWLARRERS
jgi:capsular exopolysaccharide synthesis family protein